MPDQEAHVQALTTPQAASDSSLGRLTQNTSATAQSDDAKRSSPSKSKPNKSGRHEVIVPEGAPRCTGVVVSRQEKFGFVKCGDTEARLFFHVRDTDGGAARGAQVSFIVARDATTGKDVAFDVQTLSQRVPQHDPAARGKEEGVAGSYTGAIAAMPRGPPSVKIDDGMVLFVDESGAQQHAMFGTWRVVDDPSLLTLGGRVEFSLVKNANTNVLKAVGVRSIPSTGANNPAAAAAAAHAALAAASLGAPDGPPSGGDGTLPPGRQVGRVTLLKKEFGFIKQVLRPGDLFFHFTQLDGINSEDIAVGDDVEFTVRRDREGKQSACGVCRAAPGAVVFDTVSERVMRGVVLERPVATKQYLQSSGVLEYEEESDGQRKKVRLVFSAGDCVDSAPLRPGDHASFKIATNIAASLASTQATVPGAALMAGKRAVEVTPIRTAGTVVSVHEDRKFGFIVFANPEDAGVPEDAAEQPPPPSKPQRWDVEESRSTATGPKQRRIFFHFSEVASGLNLKPGDEVTFAVHTNLNNGELNAARVKRTKQAQQTPETLFLAAATAAAAAATAAGAAATAAMQQRIPNVPTPTVTPVPIPLPLHNPNKPRLTGNLQSGEHKTQKMPRGPDGSRGFVGMGRGKALEDIGGGGEGSGTAPGSTKESSPYALFAGLPLKGIGPQMVRNLSIGASVFVPRPESTASLTSLISNGGVAD